MPYCAAYGCGRCSIRDSELSFFSFPKETVVLKQWIKKCGRAGWNPTKYSALCSVHFEENCFEEDMYHRLMGQDPTKRRRRRLLKPGAVPTIFGHGPKRKPSKPRVFSIKRAEAAERKKVSVSSSVSMLIIQTIILIQTSSTCNFLYEIMQYNEINLYRCKQCQ